MRGVENLSGQRFGRLLALRREPNPNPTGLWRCRCDCGNDKPVRISHLKAGRVRSCGCLAREALDQRNRSHGGSSTRLYRIWCGILSRCTNPNDTAFANYGGRGIRLCHEWREFASFRAWAVANGYDDSLSIDRADNDGNYEPNNCRWASRKIQNRNSRHNKLISFQGQTLTMIEWSEKAGLPYGALKWRLLNGWSIDRALLTPATRRAA